MTYGRTQAGRRVIIIVPLAALVAIAPLIAQGCSCGHDFDFHLLSWMEAARQFSHGNLHPHWAFTPAYNAGEPRFVFYPPISWVLGALLGLILTHLPGLNEAAAWSAAPILFTWIALTLSGLTMYRLARSFAGTNTALLAAIVYLANPYMLFTAYERTAYAELLAAAWIPLLFDAILRDRVTIPRIALPVALLWLTNAPAAVMGSYTLALLALLRLATNQAIPSPSVVHSAISGSCELSAKTPSIASQRDQSSGAPSIAPLPWVGRNTPSTAQPTLNPLQLALNTTAGAFLGLGLAAFYILPAAYERRFVQISMATITGMKIDQNFLFEHTGNTGDALLHDQVLHTASLIALLLLAATAIALLAAWLTKKPGAPCLDTQTWESSHNIPFPTLPLAILTAIIAFLLTPLSAPIWNHTPEASFLQFPWRLLAILTPIFSLALARALSPAFPSIAHSAVSGDPSPGAPSIAPLRWVGRKALAVATAAFILAAAFTLPAYHLFHQPCDPEDTAPARLALFHSNAGTDPTDEYTPTSADNDALHPNDPPYWLGTSADAAPPASATPGPAPTHLTLTAPNPEFLILNLRDYAAWRILRNGASIAARDPRADGLIAIPIPAGPSTLDVRYTHTSDETIGDTLTILALGLFIFALRRYPFAASPSVMASAAFATSGAKPPLSRE